MVVGSRWSLPRNMNIQLTRAYLFGFRNGALPCAPHIR